MTKMISEYGNVIRFAETKQEKEKYLSLGFKEEKPIIKEPEKAKTPKQGKSKSRTAGKK